MKKLILVTMIGLAFFMLYAQEENDVNASKTIVFSFGLRSPNELNVGIARTIPAIKEIDNEKILPSNGLQIGVSSVSPFFYVQDQDKEIVKTFVYAKNELRYVQRNYKLEGEYPSLVDPKTTYTDITSISYLDYTQKYQYDVLGNKMILPFVGVGLSWHLATNAHEFYFNGQKPNQTWINDIPLIFGIELFGFTYEYSHGTYPQLISREHSAKIHTHSFSFSLSF